MSVVSESIEDGSQDAYRVDRLSDALDARIVEMGDLCRSPGPVRGARLRRLALIARLMRATLAKFEAECELAR